MASTKTRTELKTYFVKNAIPTEANFAALIDAQINQADDGLFKEPDQALGLTATGAADRPVLRLYSSRADSAKPDWLIALNPRDPADASKSGAGLGIVDRGGNTRLLLGADGKLTVGGGVLKIGACSLAASDNALSVDKGLTVAGTLSVATELNVAGSANLGTAREIPDCNLPLGSGFYVFKRKKSQEASHHPPHPDPVREDGLLMIAVRRNCGDHQQLQIASLCECEDNKLYFRKIARATGDAGRPAWNEISTVKLDSGVLAIENTDADKRKWKISGQNWTYAMPVTFANAFSNKPTVIVGLQRLHLDNTHDTRIFAYAENIENSGFTVGIANWQYQNVLAATVFWIAYGT